MTDDDFELPPLPETSQNLPSLDNKDVQLPNEKYWEEGKIEDTSEFETDNLPVQAADKEVEEYSLTSLEKTVLVNEMKDCDMYLRNLHTGFKYVNSVRSLIHIVGASIAVHKHRRQVLNEVKQAKKAGGLTMDSQGNLIQG